ncbi:MAG: hypothetical protein JXR94_05315 [Candidatus Hydrogenedentes bacterium]|nr:hypothetical protein [Candidatus Hydrogenedentota bacterium]
MRRAFPLVAGLGAGAAALALAVVALPVRVGAGADEAEVRAALENRLAGQCGERQCEEFCAQYGDAALPVLVEAFRKPAGHGTKARLAFLLGKQGDPAGLKPMKDFLEAPFPAVLEGEGYADVWCTMMGIGFLGTADALDYLAKLATESYWLERFERDGVHPRILYKGTSRDEAESLWRLRCDAILALGASGRPEARARLEQLKADCSHPRMVREIDGMIQECLIRERVAEEKARLAREGRELSPEELQFHLLKTIIMPTIRGAAPDSAAPSGE